MREIISWEKFYEKDVGKTKAMLPTPTYEPVCFEEEIEEIEKYEVKKYEG